eukprot:7152271-Pyramimonas_sp.AAC.1
MTCFSRAPPFGLLSQARGGGPLPTHPRQPSSRSPRERARVAVSSLTVCGATGGLLRAARWANAWGNGAPPAFRERAARGQGPPLVARRRGKLRAPRFGPNALGRGAAFLGAAVLVLGNVTRGLEGRLSVVTMGGGANNG